MSQDAKQPFYRQSRATHRKAMSRGAGRKSLSRSVRLGLSVIPAVGGSAVGATTATIGASVFGAQSAFASGTCVGPISNHFDGYSLDKCHHDAGRTRIYYGIPSQYVHATSER